MFRGGVYNLSHRGHTVNSDGIKAQSVTSITGTVTLMSISERLTRWGVGVFSSQNVCFFMVVPCGS